MSHSASFPPASFSPSLASDTVIEEASFSVDADSSLPLKGELRLASPERSKRSEETGVSDRSREAAKSDRCGEIEISDRSGEVEIPDRPG
jgi:hypothetical protein